jgi:hypothetical protein
MTLMKGISNMERILNEDFIHSTRSLLIEVMKKKSHMIQFASIVNVIQMKVIRPIKDISNHDFQRSMESQLIGVRIMKMH